MSAGWRPWVLASAMALGCMRAPRPLQTTEAVARGTVAPRAEGGLGAGVSPVLRARLDELTEALSRRGLRFQSVLGHGFITHGVQVTTGLEVPAGRCISVVALASGGVRDLDAHLYDPGGDLVVEDVETDAHPTVQLCASARRTLYHVLEAYEGQGVYAIAAFEADRAGLDAVGQVLGGQPATAGSGAAARTDLERRIHEFRDGVAQRGFQGVGDPGAVTFEAPGVARLPFVVTPDRCYTLAGFAEGELSDLDLAVIDSAGDELARDVSPGRDAFLQVCPRVATTLSVEVRARQGRGRAVVLGYAADAASAGANTLWLGERLDGAVSAQRLEDVVRILDERLQAERFTAPGGLDERVRFVPGQVRELPLRVAPGRCVAVTAAGGPGVGRVRLDVYRDEAWIVRGASQGIGSAAVVCSVDPATLRVRVGPEAGSGEVRVRSHLGAAPYLPQGGRRMEASPGDGLSLPAGRWEAGPSAVVRVAPAAVHAVEARRAAGQCVRWSLGAHSPGERLVLTARDADGRSLGRSEGMGVVSLVRCGADAEYLRLEASTEGTAGGGDLPLTLRTFTRADAAVAPSPVGSRE